MQDLQKEALSACASGQVDELQSILATVNDVDRRKSNFFLSMLRSAARSCQVSIVQYLVTQDISIKIDRDTGLAIAIAGSRPIYEAVYKVDPDVVKLHFGHTGDPVTVAVSTNNIDVLSFLLDKGAGVNAGRYLSRWSPIALAAKCSTEDIVTALVHHGAQVSGSNALQHAAYYGRLDLLRCLVDLGADVNDTPDYDHVPKLFDPLETPLHSAARAGNLEIVRYLLDHGANARLKDSEGRKVSDVARGSSRESILELLGSRSRPTAHQ